jgi:hypothetical protein
LECPSKFFFRVKQETMASEWYYESMGTIMGPLTSAELLRKVRAGEIVAATRIRKDDSQWVNAIEVNGLFDAAQRAAIQYKCPYCGSIIECPPTLCLGCDREVSAAYRHREKSALPAAPGGAVSSPHQAKSSPDGANPANNSSGASWLRFWGR